MKTMESICVGPKKYRPTLTSSSFYQPPAPHSRMATLRPQSEYGMPVIPWNGYSRGSSGSGSAEWHPWSSPGSRMGSSHHRKNRFCSLLLAGGALLAVVVVLAVAGLALYMGAFRNENTDPIIAFEGRLKLRKGIGAGAGIANPAVTRLSTALRQAYSGTPLFNAMSSAEVHAINNDKLVAFFRLYLDRRKIPNTVTNLEESIRNILIENSLSKNSALRHLNVEPTSITIRRDSEHTYHSESHTASHPDPKPMPAQNAKEKILQTRMGVIRKPVSQSNLTSSPKPKTPIVSDEPEINTDELPVIQGSFQITKTEADITENKHARNFTKATVKPIPKDSTTEMIKSKTTKPTSVTRKPVTSASITQPKNKTFISIAPRSTTTSTTTTTTTTTTTSQRPITVAVTTTTVSENVDIFNKTELNSKDNLPEYLPKLDTLFAVPAYVDQEPWRPIRPGESYSTEQNYSSVELEDRMGETELIEDIPLIEGVANANEFFNVDYHNISSDSKTNQNVLSYQNLWPSYTEYPVEPVYTSFTDPAFSSTFKDTQNLGVNYPKPHPIPVNKLLDENIKTKETGKISYDNFYENVPVNTSNKVDSSYILPKDKLSTVAINVKPLVDDDSAEFVNLNGGVIIRKQNHTIISDIKHDEEMTMIRNKTGENFVKIETVNNVNKSSEPTLYSPPSKWEFVNGSNSDSSNLRKNPNKTFNETLQAVITENSDTEVKEIPFKYLPGNTGNTNSILMNITNIFNKIVSALNETAVPDGIDPTYQDTEKALNEDYPSYAQGSSEPLDMKDQELLMKELIEQASSSTILPTLLPVKSNSGIGRPLRPRPKLPLNQEKNGEDRSFTNKDAYPFLTEVKSFIQNLKPDASNETNTETTSIKTDIVTSISYTSNSEASNGIEQDDIPTTTIDFIKYTLHDYKIPEAVSKEPSNNKKIDISEKFRLPKTHSSDAAETKIDSNPVFLDDEPTATEYFTSTQALNDKVKMLIRDQERESTTSFPSTSPVGQLLNNTDDVTDESVRVKIHVESSISSSLHKNVTTDPISNEDILEIIKKIPNNANDSKTSTKEKISADKLRHLASIATISDSHNNTFFSNENAPDDTIISTKAVSSSYVVNNAGFKVLTKTFNKIPGNFKDDEKKSNKFNDAPIQSFYDGSLQVTDADDCNNKNYTVKCSNGQCLPETARCNRLLDCPGGEDELGCTCADYLKSQFLIRKLCDGILDCWDFSDENNCDWCSPEQYVCSNSRQCIDKDKICDGTKDCPLGDDEKQCVTVAKSQEDAKSYPYSKEGYIMVQKHGQWGRLCVQNFDKVIARSHSSLQISDLGRAVCRTMTYIDYENVDRVIEDNSDKDDQYFSLYYTSKGDTSKGGLAFRRSGCSRGHVAKVICSQLQCGARPQAASQQARIVGGGNAGAGAWPWQAALYKEGDFQCGATLISDRWLISAGHCFYHAQEDFWVARLGALRRGTSFPSPYEQLQPISSVILHPGYVDTGFINDIALLKMANSVSFSDYVRPICLPPFATDMEDGRRCTVIGWGQLFEVGRIFPDTLQEVELPVISTSECRKRTLFLPLYRITDDMFCAGFDRGGRDACLGDSGGPLMCQEQDNQWYLYGVTSNGYGCARANRPGVYTKVSNYINWIQTTMQVYDDRSYDQTHEYRVLKNSSHPDLDVSESRSLHRHAEKCRGHRCPLGECLPPTRVCNGFMECSDGSDERDCR